MVLLGLRLLLIFCVFLTTLGSPPAIASSEGNRHRVHCGRLILRLEEGDHAVFQELLDYLTGDPAAQTEEGRRVGAAFVAEDEAFLIRQLKKLKTKSGTSIELLMRVLECPRTRPSVATMAAVMLFRWNVIEPLVARFLPDAFASPNDAYSQSALFAEKGAAIRAIVDDGNNRPDKAYIAALSSNYWETYALTNYRPDANTVVPVTMRMVVTILTHWIDELDSPLSPHAALGMLPMLDVDPSLNTVLTRYVRRARDHGRRGHRRASALIDARLQHLARVRRGE